MLWYKSWLDTRTRFFVGLVLLLLSACGVVFAYPRVLRLLPLVPDLKDGGVVAAQIRENAELIRSFRGYIFAQWFRENLRQFWLLFAVLLGSGSVVASGSDGAALFTLSLPVTRRQLLASRALTGLAELFVLAFVPSLAIALLAPAVGASYSLADVLIHGLCLFVGGVAFFHLALFASTLFDDLWRPLLISIGVGIGWRIVETLAFGRTRFALFAVMSADSYFFGTGLPWLGLLVSAAASAALAYGAAANLARRDF